MEGVPIKFPISVQPKNGNRNTTTKLIATVVPSPKEIRFVCWRVTLSDILENLCRIEKLIPNTTTKYIKVR